MTSHSGVIIHDFNVGGTSIRPNEANPPLIVDPDTVLTDTISLKDLKPVAWRREKIFQPVRGVQHVELPGRNSGDTPPIRRSLPVRKKCSVSGSAKLWIMKALDHDYLNTLRNA